MKSVLQGLNSHTKSSQIFFLLFSILFPKPILFICNSATIGLKDYFNRGVWYNMSGKKMFCVLPQCQNPCSVLGTAPVFISEGSRMTQGAVLAAVGRSLIVAFWASNFCCKNCSHTLPSGKSRADGSPIPPTLKDRHIFCSTCVAQGQNLQRWLPTKMSLSLALERSTEDSEIGFKAFLSFSFLRK